MNHALPMHYNFNVLRLLVKKPAGLDQFKPLVHKRGGIDCYFCTHRPIGMMQRLFHRYISKLFCSFSIKRAAGGSQNHLFYAVMLVSLHGLKNRRMLAVHRQNRHTLFSCSGNHELSAGHKRLFICKGDRFPCRYSGERRPKAYHSDNGIEHHVAFFHGGQLA